MDLLLADWVFGYGSLIWNPEIEKKIDYSMMHDAVGYTPYEGHVYKGWPEIVINRGRVVVENNELKVERGSGQFLKRKPSDMLASPTGISAAVARQMLRSLVGMGGPA